MALAYGSTGQTADCGGGAKAASSHTREWGDKHSATEASGRSHCRCLTPCLLPRDVEARGGNCVDLAPGLILTTPVRAIAWRRGRRVSLAGWPVGARSRDGLGRPAWPGVARGRQAVASVWR